MHYIEKYENNKIGFIEKYKNFRIKLMESRILQRTSDYF